MRGTRVVVLWLVLAACAGVHAGQRDVRTRQARRLKQGGNSKCKYFRKGEISECDEATETKSVTFHLKKGVNCAPTQVFHQPCSQADEAAMADGDTNKDCKYDRKAVWTQCTPGVLSKVKVMTLKAGQSASCPPTRSKTVPCKKRKNQNNKMRKNKKKKGSKGKGKACKYQKGAWSECDGQTNTRTRQLTLKKGDDSVCLPRKTITKKCKKPCKYNKGAWLPCNEATNEKMRQLTLKKGDPSVCNATLTITKPCRRRGAFTAAKTSQCRYKALGWGECEERTNTMRRVLRLKSMYVLCRAECRYKALGWGECEERTNTMRRVLRLKSGDPALCQPTKELTRKCRKTCKFSKGDWSECDEDNDLRTRTDQLVKGDKSKCEATRTISRKCGDGEDCKYEIGDWGECDSTSQERTRTKTLLSGDPDTCKPTINVSRPCFKPNGEESCFLGNWGDYGPCQNGVMMKHRPVIAGGVQCERKAVKTKPCS